MIKKLNQLLCLTLLLISLFINIYQYNHNYTYNGIYITAAHIHTSYIPKNYKLLYKDASLDMAWYLDTNFKGIRQPIQEIVIENFVNPRMVATYSGYFEVEVDNIDDIKVGMSGTYVYNKSNYAIGYVSMKKNNRIICTAISQ